MATDPARRCWICRRALGLKPAILLPFRFYGRHSALVTAHADCAEEFVVGRFQPRAIPNSWPPP